mmetsp:Transcript_10947/g.14464  ORF Transcript_10947/g.14464 Transcript_10947/m.14464 type:complete len:196 (+) Transcript_10947:162-749(+)|eukprot:CAMPEP_0198145908 /NCGR_PEP_ID=MMETSP1443-20131203/26072_1 /TAXON_ID=186043 /ORGANISM="Entomoneis sp., Strain CCMP2396" /LENGTH=195 /DNA_ID=CAMNT_0043809669 /DNA_START=66 /DNA_END=653 /DNA_ORIENTATION=+
MVFVSNGKRKNPFLVGKSLEELELMLANVGNSSQVEITGLEMLGEADDSFSSEEPEDFASNIDESSCDSYADDSFDATKTRLGHRSNAPRRHTHGNERLALHMDMDTQQILQKRGRNRRFESLGGEVPQPSLGFGRRSSIGCNHNSSDAPTRGVTRRSSMGARIPAGLKDINDSGSVVAIPGDPSFTNNGVGRAA